MCNARRGWALGLMILLIMPALGGTVAVASEYYVATNGDDGWSGTPASANAAKTDGPFATIEHARDVIRALDSTSRSKAIR